MKIPKEQKKFLQQEFKQYWINKKKLKKLIEKDNNTSTRSIVFLQERIGYIEAVISQLEPFELELFNLIYRDGCNCLYCMNEKNITKNTYYNIINKTTNLLAKEYGFI